MVVIGDSTPIHFTGSNRSTTIQDAMERAIQEALRHTDSKIEEIETEAKMRIAEERERGRRRISEIIRSFCDVPHSQRSMKLMFRHKISLPVMTGDEIKGEGDVFIEVALIDCSSGSVVEVGREAFATVEIVILKGDAAVFEGDDWRTREFDDSIVRESEGKTHFLVGNINLKLCQGVAVLRDVKFRHGAIKMKPPIFRLGAKVVDASAYEAHIKEATTESFTLVSYHRKYNEKYDNPSLSDKVYRLVNITRRGPTGVCLQAARIFTVEDFLIQLLIDPKRLKKIFKLGNLKWEATVRNARACQNVDNWMYCYISPEKATSVVFNVLGQIRELYLEHQFIPMNMLSDYQKVLAKLLLEYAYKNWEKSVVRFGDEQSLHQHIQTSLKKEKQLLLHSTTTATTTTSSSITLRYQALPMTNPEMKFDGSLRNTNADDAVAVSCGMPHQLEMNVTSSQELTIPCYDYSLQQSHSQLDHHQPLYRSTNIGATSLTCVEPPTTVRPDSDPWFQSMIGGITSQTDAGDGSLRNTNAGDAVAVSCGMPHQLEMNVTSSQELTIPCCDYSLQQSHSQLDHHQPLYRSTNVGAASLTCDEPPTTDRPDSPPWLRSMIDGITSEPDVVMDLLWEEELDQR